MVAHQYTRYAIKDFEVQNLYFFTYISVGARIMGMARFNVKVIVIVAVLLLSAEWRDDKER